VVLGVLNVTLDSFSDGGRFLSTDAAIARGIELVEEGADIVDIGGESTRPGAAPVTEDEELTRVIPVVRALAARGALVSVDTTKSSVLQASFEAGAWILNDVAMGEPIATLAAIVARHGGSYLRMHARGTPSTMRQDPSLSSYPDGVGVEVARALALDANAIERAGVERSRIWLDPGIGFAKRAAQSLELLATLDPLLSLGYAVCVGPSRKSFIDAPEAYAREWGTIVGSPERRIGGTAAAVTAAVLAGAHAIRVHDVSVMRQAARVAHAIREARRGGAR
jgi:dihydropteroate synthase